MPYRIIKDSKDEISHTYASDERLNEVHGEGWADVTEQAKDFIRPIVQNGNIVEGHDEVSPEPTEMEKLATKVDELEKLIKAQENKDSAQDVIASNLQAQIDDLEAEVNKPSSVTTLWTAPNAKTAMIKGKEYTLNHSILEFDRIVMELVTFDGKTTYTKRINPKGLNEGVDLSKRADWYFESRYPDQTAHRTEYGAVTFFQPDHHPRLLKIGEWSDIGFKILRIVGEIN